MPKNIVICSDGTGNSAIKDRGTNVFKLYEAVDLSQGDQIAFYDDGVGTESFKPLQLLGGAFGYGLSRNVRQLYADLVRVYDPGDRIYLFGFSRGAFTARTLADFIVTCGILDRAKFGTDQAIREKVKEAYRDVYRRKYQALLQRLRRPLITEEERTAFRKEWGVVHPEHAPDGIPFIEFVGVWDTVAAVGFPVDEIADFVNYAIHQFKFPDHVLSAHVRRGRHALAIDDERHTFHPLLWDERMENQDAPRIEQVWFAGVHSNVGGGYPKQGMSLVALDWMMSQAGAAGLRFVGTDWAAFSAHRNVHDNLYNSRAGLAAYYHYKPRDIAGLCGKNGVTPKVHVSALERIGQGTKGYAPGNLPVGLRIVETRPTRRNLAAAEGMIQAARPKGGAPLDDMRDEVSAREWNQTLTIALSFAAVLGMAYLGAKEKDLWPIAKELLSLLFSADVPGLISMAGRSLWAYPVRTIVLILLPIAFYLRGQGIKGRMDRVYGEFWFRLAPGLRKLLC